LKEKPGSSRTLLLVSLSVFLSSSTWFSGTAAAPILGRLWSLNEVQSSWLTISVQIGFIFGTVLFALLNLSDIFNARKFYFLSAVAGAVFNLAFAYLSSDLETAVVFRFLTGVTLAGIYPVGMKIITQWFRSGLGWRLGIMVGALTLGTALPYLNIAIGSELHWRFVVVSASFLSLLGGGLIFLLVTDGPYLKGKPEFKISIAFRLFSHRRFRLQAVGYFGHMWELYAFWSLHSVFLSASFAAHGYSGKSIVSLVAFLTIGLGTIGCISGGWISRRKGEKKVALVSLLVSGTLCATSGLLYLLPPGLLSAFMLLWGIFVISDSPQFSALAARYCPPEYTGTALTIQNGIGFAITVISIQLTAWLSQSIGWQWAFSFLTLGPVIGIGALLKIKEKTDF